MRPRRRQGRSGRDWTSASRLARTSSRVLAYVAAWDQIDIDGLAALARADAARTTLIERLRPVGGGWVQLPETGAAQTDMAFRPAFMNV